ncbi:hypothetical protein HYE82_10250 [Streptomyces sp. BR123]|uniref:hypothetical protein n=1 Tax=Streptomyces sp. BR123 TaxID=2749828 RepID=UPI0015C4DC0B|nr:hypothetical protein [Streptomyces sp. BR123]NXY94766.1 hypothetical protein [Streptomyces sp. BR123]
MAVHDEGFVSHRPEIVLLDDEVGVSTASGGGRHLVEAHRHLMAGSHFGFGPVPFVP